MQWSEVATDRTGGATAHMIATPPIARSHESFGPLLSVTWKIHLAALSATWHTRWKSLSVTRGSPEPHPGCARSPSTEIADAIDWGMTVKRTLRIGLAGATVALLVPVGAAPARADDDGAAPGPRVTQLNQVSDDPAQHPKLVDPNVVNAWGLALSATSPIWVANNGTNTATLYPGGLNGAAVSPSP